MKTIYTIYNNSSFRNRVIVVLLATLFGLPASSCKKFLEIDPPKDSARTSQIFENDDIATSSVTGVYSRMAASGAFSGDQSSISSISGLAADELKSHNIFLDDFYKNQIATSNSNINTLWSNSYAYIYTSNAILEGLNGSNGLTENTKKQLQGEAKFIRAFCYFYLVNLFGAVPLSLTTDYRINEVAAKSSKEKIYSQITMDLVDAENLLSNNYISTERIRPNKWAAKALLSRVYLYEEKWELASKKATEVIDQKTMYSLDDDLDKVFLKNSNEAIWQLMPTAGRNTNEGTLFVLNATPLQVSLSPGFLPLFETGDVRKSKWTSQYTNTTGTYFYPFKYKLKTTVNGVISEYSMVIRLAELYLIRAEARAKLVQINLALEDINFIRKRARLSVPLVALTQAQCIAEVEKQRRFELFSEWGHRWLDLKRTGRATTILAPVKGANWKDTDVLFPIPDNEINRNINVGQNLGY